LTARFLLY